VKKLRHPPEVFPFKPSITKYNPETDSKKRLLAQRLLKERLPHDKSDQLRSLIDHKMQDRETAVVNVQAIDFIRSRNDETPQMSTYQRLEDYDNPKVMTKE